MVTNCGVGATRPRRSTSAHFASIRLFSKETKLLPIGEMPIRKAITPLEFAGDLKEQLAKLAPTRILEDDETPRTGWLIEGEFTVVDGGDPAARFFFGTFGVGRSFLAMHVRVTDVDKGITVYEFDMAGGSHSQGRHGTIRASGMGRATAFDLVNAAERIYLVLDPNAFRYGARTSWRCTKAADLPGRIATGRRCSAASRPLGSSHIAFDCRLPSKPRRIRCSGFTRSVTTPRRFFSSYFLSSFVCAAARGCTLRAPL